MPANGVSMYLNSLEFFAEASVLNIRDLLEAGFIREARET
jgi:hypothetical protein